MARTFALLLTLFSAMPTYADVVAAAEGSSNSSTASNLSVADEKVKDSNEPAPAEATLTTKALEATDTPKKCPDVAKVRGICSSISSRTEDKDPNSSYVYEYQRQIYEASCVDLENDPESVIAQKVQKLWQLHEKDMKCNSAHLDVTNGSILKLAVVAKFREVLEDAAQVWRINLNAIDESDGRTILDYVEKEIRNNPDLPALKTYYRILRQSGAKHKREL